MFTLKTKFFMFVLVLTSIVTLDAAERRQTRSMTKKAAQTVAALQIAEQAANGNQMENADERAAHLLHPTQHKDERTQTAFAPPATEDDHTAPSSCWSRCCRRFKKS